MKYNVAVIGCGQLGSRHLQGLKKANIEMSVYAVDASENSLNVAKDRYNQIPENEYTKDINFVSSISNLPDVLDLVIIATGSKPRCAIAQQLLNEKKVSNIVFEKFLFPRLADYDIINDLLYKKNVKAWVNCPRRMFDYYDKIYNIIDKSSHVKMSVIGKNWGLCCNAIHFIDIFLKLVDENEFMMDLSKLDNNIIESKRAGYIELLGTIELKTKNENLLTLSSLVETDIISTIKIVNGHNVVDFDEANGILLVNDTKFNIKTKYQSELTNVVAENILTKGNCSLTKYEASALYHKQFLMPILDFYNKITGLHTDLCPIT